MLKAKKDLTGQIFGRWKVICQAEDHISSSGKHEIAWLCECACELHTKKIVLQRSLLYGTSKSCGCLQKEKVHNIFFNDLTGEKFGRLKVVKRVDEQIKIIERIDDKETKMELLFCSLVLIFYCDVFI